MTLVRLTGLNDTRQRQDVKISSCIPPEPHPEAVGVRHSICFLAVGVGKLNVPCNSQRLRYSGKCKRRSCTNSQVLESCRIGRTHDVRCGRMLTDRPPVSQPRTFAGCGKRHRLFAETFSNSVPRFRRRIRPDVVRVPVYLLCVCFGIFLDRDQACVGCCPRSGWDGRGSQPSK